MTLIANWVLVLILKPVKCQRCCSVLFTIIMKCVVIVIIVGLFVVSNWS